MVSGRVLRSFLGRVGVFILKKGRGSFGGRRGLKIGMIFYYFG